MAAPALPTWKAAVIQGLQNNGVNVKLTPAVDQFLDNWARAEGGGATNNPFNTTWDAPGATPYNSVGVRNYLSPQQGIHATVQTLTNGKYGNILQAMTHGQSAMAMAQALAASPWGTGGLVVKMLGGQPSISGAAPSPAVGGAPSLNATPVLKQPTAPPLAMNNQELLDFAGPGAATQRLLGGMGTVGQAALDVSTKAIPLPTQVQTQQGAAIGTPVVMHADAKDPRQLQAVATVKQYLGDPYVWGGEDPGKGFDCSGLLQYTWAKQGVQIPRTTYDQWTAGKSVDPVHLQPGDAVFFKGSDSKTVNGKTLPGHVGMYIGGGKFIEAPHTGSTVHISNLAGRSDFMGARRYV